MHTALSRDEIFDYAKRQVAAIAPLPARFGEPISSPAFLLALERYRACVQEIRLPSYRSRGDIPNPLHTDQWCLFYCYLANTLYLEDSESHRAACVYLANKTLHGMNLLYDVALPRLFLVVHPVGSVIGRAVLPERLVIAQNCTIGAIGARFPTLSEGLVLGSGSSVIGPCTIGRNVVLEPGTSIVKHDVESNVRVGGSQGRYTTTAFGNRAVAWYFRVELEPLREQVPEMESHLAQSRRSPIPG